MGKWVCIWDDLANLNNGLNLVHTRCNTRTLKNQHSMKNLILIVFSLFLSQTVLSQEISKEQIYGTWKIQKNITSITDPKYKDLINGFKEASFTFNENGIFELKSANTSKLFLMTTNMLKNAKWKLDQNKQIIRIGNEENHFSTMGIKVKLKDSKTIFLVDETPLEFEMVKEL
jgi:hypothetical protein